MPISAPIFLKARHVFALTTRLCASRDVDKLRPIRPEFFIVAAFLAFPAHAQYSGPSEVSQASVAEILKSPVDDQDVRLQGHLLRQSGREKYVFSDGTGEIVADIDDDDFPAQEVNEKTKVELIGEVDTSLRRPPKIDVESVRVID